MKTIDLTCPICTGIMDLIPGDGIVVTNGVTVVCNNKDCLSTENVFGHGKNEKDAYEVAGEKFHMEKFNIKK